MKLQQINPLANLQTKSQKIIYLWKTESLSVIMKISSFVYNTMR